jgi:hypothetical protein
MVTYIFLLDAYRDCKIFQPITVAVRSKALTVFARSNTEIMGSNPTGDMDVCVCSVCVYSVSTQCGGG